MSGFESPNYTQTPNDLFDSLLPEMGLAELKVVMCVVRNTFGFHREDVKLSIRTIARATGLTVNSVMDGATKAEAHGLLERMVDGNKTTTWRAIVSVVPAKTPRLTSRDTRVSPSETLLGVKERENKESNKRGDLVDGMLELSQSPGIKKLSRINAILSYLGTSLHINAETKRWQEFARYVDDRQQTYGEKLDTFIGWMTGQKDFDIKFWSPNRMRELWPLAFESEAFVSEYRQL